MRITDQELATLADFGLPINHPKSAAMMMAVLDLQEARKTLLNAEKWLGKMIADEGHLASVAPNHAVRTLEMIDRALRGEPTNTSTAIGGPR